MAQNITNKAEKYRNIVKRKLTQSKKMCTVNLLPLQWVEAMNL